MSGVLCFVSQDGPFAEDTQNDAFSPQENATFVYRNEEELDQVVSRTDPSIVHEPQTITRMTTPTNQTPAVNLVTSHPIDIGPVWLCLGKMFNSTIFSVILILVTVAVSITLGAVSVFAFKPAPYFDKSLDAFQIPNHDSTKRWEALDLAKKDMYLKRSKRSLEDNDAQFGDDAIINDAIDDKLKSQSTGSLSSRENKKLFLKYQNSLPAPLVGDTANLPNIQSNPLHRHRRDIRRYRTTVWKLTLVYIAQGKGELNIFTPERLETIHNVEMNIMKHDGFTRFCSRNYQSFNDPALAALKYCSPPNSLMTYFYPSRVGNKIIYDGVGDEQADVNGTLSWAMQKESFYWFVDTTMNSSNKKSAFMRTEVYFGKPIGDETGLSSEYQFAEYKKFLESYIELFTKSSTSEVLVLYGGTELFDYEVSETIHHDLMLAIPCIISIAILLFILTSFSLWLTICGCLSILLSFCWAYFVFHVLCGIDALGLLNLVSAFVVIGIGVDDVFVFVNTYRQADHIHDAQLRMAYTVKTAGTATFFTSVTTAGAFAANMASQIPAIYSFGLFMMLVVSFCWMTVFLMMPPALNLWRKWIHCEVHCFPSDSSTDTVTPIASPGLQRILSAHQQQESQRQQQQGRNLSTISGQQGTVLDDDIPMLDIEDDVVHQIDQQHPESCTATRAYETAVPKSPTISLASSTECTAVKHLGVYTDDDDDPMLDIEDESGDKQSFKSLALQHIDVHPQQPKSPTRSTSSAVFTAARQYSIPIDDDDDAMIDIVDDQHHEYSLVQTSNDHQQPASPTPSTSAVAAARQLGMTPIDDVNDETMLDIGERPHRPQGLLGDDDDVPIINLDNVTVSTVVGDGNAKRNVGGITRLLQQFLKKFVADPVIKMRWVVVAMYLVVVGVSLTLVLQIQPSSRPPALYKEDTNLQRLLDLAYNFSSADIQCKTCSGFFQETPSQTPLGPVTLPPIITTKGLSFTTHKMTTTSAATTWTNKAPAEPTKPALTTQAHTTKPAPTRQAHTTKSELNIVTEPPRKQTTKQHPTTMILPTMKTTTEDMKKKTCKDVDLHCKFGAKCLEDPYKGPICQCESSCQILLDPVCDTEGNTHVNDCELKVVSCSLQKEIIIAHRGSCQVTGKPNYPPEPYSPPGGGGGGGGEPGPRLPPKPPSGGDTGSAGVNYNPCNGGSCGNAASRPILDNTAVVYVVFGIQGVDTTNNTHEHVLNEDKGTVVYDDKFDLSDPDTLKALCKMCKGLADRKDIVMPGGAECFPKAMERMVQQLEHTIPECAHLPQPILLKNQRSKAMGATSSRGDKLMWLAMAFESTSYMGKSSFEAFQDYMLWEQALKSLKEDLGTDALDSAFQTSEYWKQVFMEIVGVTSAIYGLAFSLFVTIIAVVIFTAHVGILLIAFFTISGVILVVISMFYLLGWQMGAVEAVSLSILVGSSVDYCIHLIEGYLVAGDEIPNAETKSNGALRQWRTRQALTTIGVSILSSAITTMIAAIPLSCTTIQIFAKFGKIVAINTFVSILFTLTACSAFLSCFAPAKYRWNWKWLLISSAVVGALFGGFILALYSLHRVGYTIPGPSGDTLFS